MKTRGPQDLTQSPEYLARAMNRVDKKILILADHMLWQGSFMGTGKSARPQMGFRSQTSKTGFTEILVHRFLWEQKNGPIPKTLLLSNTCGLQRCVNPMHHKLISSSERANMFGRDS